MYWYITALKKYADFSGRARRKEFWVFNIFNMVFLVGATILDLILSSLLSNDQFIPIISVVFSLFIVVPSLAVTVRRLHDIGKSGIWILVQVIPYIGPILLLILMAIDSQRGDNQYGPNPKGVETTETQTIILYSPPEEKGDKQFMMPESPNSNSGKYDFLLFSERLYNPWYTSTSTPAKCYFVIFILRSTGVFEQIYKSYFFDAIGTVPWGYTSIVWKEAEEYKSFKGKKIFRVDISRLEAITWP